MKHQKATIGRNVYVDLPGYATQVPAKVDTGADSSSIWASNVRVLPSNVLQFTLFGKESPFYDGKIVETTQYTIAKVRSSSGHEQIRYQVKLPVVIKGRRIRACFNLSDRSLNHFPILVGRKTLNKKFIVDVSVADEEIDHTPVQSALLNDEMNQDPYGFYKKYHSNGTNR